jgi:hypothetical protein
LQYVFHLVTTSLPTDIIGIAHAKRAFSFIWNMYPVLTYVTKRDMACREIGQPVLLVYISIRNLCEQKRVTWHVTKLWVRFCYCA